MTTPKGASMAEILEKAKQMGGGDDTSASSQSNGSTPPRNGDGRARWREFTLDQLFHFNEMVCGYGRSKTPSSSQENSFRSSPFDRHTRQNSILNDGYYDIHDESRQQPR